MSFYIGFAVLGLLGPYVMAVVEFVYGEEFYEAIALTSLKTIPWVDADAFWTDDDGIRLHLLVAPDKHWVTEFDANRSTKREIVIRLESAPVMDNLDGTQKLRWRSGPDHVVTLIDAGFMTSTDGERNLWLCCLGASRKLATANFSGFATIEPPK